MARREPAAMRALDRDAAAELREEAQQQWWLQQQWLRLRSHANGLGVKLLGDLPFYGAHDSADVWSRPGLFSLRRDGSLSIRGVPPDYFSAQAVVVHAGLPLVASLPERLPLVA